MTVYNEPGFEITLPGIACFRFQDCPAYVAIKGSSVREMDFAWIDDSSGEFRLLELEDFVHLSKSEQMPEYLIQRFQEKAIDSLLMLSALWLATPFGVRLRESIPQAIHHRPPRIKLYFVVNLSEAHQSYIGPLKDKLSTRLKGKCEIVGARLCIWNKQTAITNGLPIR